MKTLLKFIDKAQIAPTAQPSLCDSCAKPGACCTRIKLFRGSGKAVAYARAEWKAEAQKLVDENNFPFVPVEPFDFNDAPHLYEYVGVVYSCRNLTPEGRCGDYENRPDLCKAFEPGKDMLCTMHPPTLVDDQGRVKQ